MPAPSFDIVRVDPDGQTVIAGRSEPNQLIEVLLDGEAVDTALADSSGKFVAVIEAGASNAARELRLRVTLPDRSAATSFARPGTPEGAAISDEAAMPAAEIAAGPRRPAAPRASGAPSDQIRAAPSAAFPSGEGAAGEGAAGEGAAGEGVAGDLAPGRQSAAEVQQAEHAAPAEGGPARSGEAEPLAQQLLSDPVVILPPVRAGDAPALVQSDREQLTLLQPAGPAPERVVLDQLTRAPDGDLLLRGRARPRHAVRVYGNGREIGTVPVADGIWSLTVPGARAGDIRLFRLDEIRWTGEVASRVEVPFEPSDAGSHVLRDRTITVQRGDNLWRIAEQHYGEGLRYSLIFGANSDLIRDPDLIYPDQVFTVPELVEAE